MKTEIKNYKNIKTNSENQIIVNTNQSAGNLIEGSSETIRKLSLKEMD
jgi:hypothetical protein